MFLDQDNMVILRGRLGKDAEIRYMQDGTCCANLSLATSYRYKDKNGERQERTEWHRVVGFGRQMEAIKDWLEKGREISLVGTLRTRKWQDRDGNDRYTTEVHIVDIKLRGGNGQGQQSQQGGGGQTQGQQAPQQAPQQPDWDAVPGDSDIPF